MVLERRFEQSGKGLYLASRPAVPEFSAIINSVKGHRDQYNELVASGRFPGLERAQNKDAALEAMAEWERSHQDDCELMEEQVDPTAILRRFTVLFVGAFEDPAHHIPVEGKGALSRLLERVIDKSAIDEKLREVADEAAERSDEILTEATAQLNDFHASMKDQLNRFAPGCSINVRWGEAAVEGARPRLHVDIETEGGVRRPLEYQGHGVQRSMMYAALTAEVELGGGGAEDLLLIIEEPEAFQHPLSCRVLAETLRTLAKRDYQIAYSTHSPEFVLPDMINGLRIVQRDNRSGTGLATYIESLGAERLVDEWEHVFQGADYTTESVLGRLRPHLTAHVIEGLFARCCILVEGEEDEAFVRAAAAQRGMELDASGVAVVQTNGKPGMPNVVTFLGLAGVGCYPIFDLDRSNKVEDQSREAEEQILRALRVSGEVDPGVHDAYACWREDLGAAVRADLAPRYDELLQQAAESFGYPRASRAKKVGLVLTQMVRLATEDGLSSQTLDSLEEKIQDIAEGVGASRS